MIEAKENWIHIIDKNSEQFNVMSSLEKVEGDTFYSTVGVFNLNQVVVIPIEHLKSYEKVIFGNEHLNSDMEVSKGGALRYNKGKPQFSHLSPYFIMEMMKGMTAANQKYPYLNYTKKQDVRTAADSLMRHFLKFQQGMDVDEELNTHHLALVAINAMIMFQNLQDFGDEVDNRYSKAKDEVQK